MKKFTVYNVAYVHNLFFNRVGPRFYLMLGFTILSAIAELIGLSLIFPLLELFNTGERTNESLLSQIFVSLEDNVKSPKLLSPIFIFGAVFSFFVLKAIFYFFSLAIIARLTTNLMQSLKKQMFEAYAEMKFSYYSQKDTGYFLNIANEQINLFVTAFNNYAKFLGLFSTTLIYFCASIFVNTELTLYLLFGGLFILLILKNITFRLKRISKFRADESGNLNAAFIQLIQYFKYLSATASFEKVSPILLISLEKMKSLTYRMNLLSALAQASREPLVLFLVIGIVAYEINSKSADLASLIVFLLIFYKGISSVLALVFAWQGMMENIGSVEIVSDEFEVLKQKKQLRHQARDVFFEEAIEFENVDFQYDEKASFALKGVNLKIQKNTTVALIGHSGSGKSTIIDLLTRLVAPVSGKIKVDGVDVSDLDLDQWREMIGFVSQDPVIFNTSLRNNITLFFGEDSTGFCDDLIWTALEQANIKSYIESLPSGLDTEVGDRGIQLSGGQRQRLAIARELYKQPRILVLDEATSALDSESELKFLECLKSLSGQITIVTIAHRLASIKACDIYYFLRNGKIIETGKIDEMSKDKASAFSKFSLLQNM